jgi:hypothetical protein
VLEFDRAFLDDGLVGEDRRVGANRERDGITWSRIDLDLGAVHRDGDDRVERVLAELSDRDPHHAGLELVEHVGDEIVSHGPGRARALQLHEDRGCLGMPDPDG